MRMASGSAIISCRFFDSSVNKRFGTKNRQNMAEFGGKDKEETA